MSFDRASTTEQAEFFAETVEGKEWHRRAALQRHERRHGENTKKPLPKKSYSPSPLMPAAQEVR